MIKLKLLSLPNNLTDKQKEVFHVGDIVITEERRYNLYKDDPTELIHVRDLSGRMVMGIYVCRTEPFEEQDGFTTL